MIRKRPSSLLKLRHLITAIFLAKSRGLLELCKIDFLSKPYGIEKMEYHNNLMKYIDFNKGFFIELGGYDGFFHSPTYYLEKFKNWEGILIEPHPVFYKKCVKNRSKSTVYNVACSLESDIKNDTAVLNSIGHSSYLQNSLENDDFLQEILDGISQEKNSYKVKAISLTRVLNAHFDRKAKQQIDLLCIDVEGSELSVLYSLDFKIYNPRYILCESRTQKEKNIVESYLRNFGYSYVDKISHQDYLYKLD